MENFDSPKILLREANSHIEKIDIIISEFFTDCEAISFVDIEPDTGNKLFKFRFSKTKVPDRVNYLANTVINDLRHSLDQAACTAFSILTGNTPPKTLYFPITDNLADLNGRLRKDFPESLHEAFRVIAPYRTGNDIICLLAKTAQEKHVSICDISGFIGGSSGKTGMATGIINMVIPPVWDFTNNEVLVAKTTPDGVFEAEFAYSPEITFKNTRHIDGQPIIPFLRAAFEATSMAINVIEAAVI